MRLSTARFNIFKAESAHNLRQHGIWLAPGMFFFLIGIVALIAPRLVIIAVAAVFFFLGAVVCALGWKLMQLKGRVEKMARQFEGRVVVQGVNIQPEASSDIEIEQKKIVFH